METDLILALALAGVTLGIVEGIKPGPLLTWLSRRHFQAVLELVLGRQQHQYLQTVH